MFKPSPVLGARLRLTTKQVNKGYYKGNRTGSVGAHTEYGGYIVDYRKVRHFNVPDLSEFKLTPFVTRQMEPTKWEQQRPDGTVHSPPRVDGMEYLRQWKKQNPEEYDYVIHHQQNEQLIDERAETGVMTDNTEAVSENFSLESVGPSLETEAEQDSKSPFPEPAKDKP